MPLTTTTSIDFETTSGEPGGQVVFVNQSPCDREPEPITLKLPHSDWIRMGCPNSVRVHLETKCEGCGCTDSRACEGGCSWAEPGLCSRCA